MSSASSSLLIDMAAVILTGFCVKFLDDYIDREADLLSERASFGRGFGRLLLPYSVLALAIACILNARLAASLVFACWALGMLSDEEKKFPLGLPGWLESLAIVVLGGALAGAREMVTSLVAAFAIQAIDDVMDYAQGGHIEARNLARRLGRRMAAILALMALVVGGLWDFRKMALVAVGAAAVFSVERLFETEGGRRGA